MSTISFVPHPTDTAMQHQRIAITTILLCHLVATLRAQAGIATSGRVVDAAGDPVGRATVTFAGDRPPLHLASTTPHVVTATTDEQGRFRTGLRPGHEYCAWAVGEAELDARYRVSALHDEVLPGASLTIPLVRRRSSTTAW